MLSLMCMGARPKPPAGVWRQGCPATGRACRGASCPSGGARPPLHRRPRRWAASGGWQRGGAHLAGEADQASALLAATLVRVHPHTAGAPGGPRPQRAAGAAQADGPPPYPPSALPRATRPAGPGRWAKRVRSPERLVYGPLCAPASRQGWRRQPTRRRHEGWTCWQAPVGRPGPPQEQPQSAAWRRGGNVESQTPAGARLRHTQAVQRHCHPRRPKGPPGVFIAAAVIWLN